MAKVGKNIITTGLSGMVGDQIVFRNRGGKTIVSAAPVKKDRDLTDAQKEHAKEFQEAVLYGKSIIADDARKAAYQAEAEEGQSAFNVAVADFLNAPSIDEIDVSNYNGSVGSTIRVRAIDDFKVAGVLVTICNSDGTLVESGVAVQQVNGVDWIFTATASNSDIAGDKIVVKVSDVPGNLTEKSALI